MGEKIITILGPTASGKTHLATHLALDIGAEIISADSRQVYRGMTIGTGKDLLEYRVGELTIPYHLIDILDAGEKYNLALFQKDFHQAVKQIRSRNKPVVLCGGTGLYIQSVVVGFGNTVVPENELIRSQYSAKTDEELKVLLEQVGEKFDTRKRAVRKLEILAYKDQNQLNSLSNSPNFGFVIFGLNPERDLRRKRISDRLKIRLEQEGMITEVENLIRQGLSFDDLEYYGLEYKYISYYLKGDLSYESMYTSLETAIHRFAKRQMTFFRSMEKKGIEINWLDDGWSTEEKMAFIREKVGD